jgi:hypothetical protein
VDSHIAVGERWSAAETLNYMRMRAAQAAEILIELLVRCLQELGPEQGARLLVRVGAGAWNLGPVAPTRIEAETLTGRARRRALPAMTQDIEHVLGPVPRHKDFLQAMALARAVPAAA